MNRRSNSSSALKVPPHSAEAEQAVIGAVFINPESLNNIGHLLPEDFYNLQHREIFTAIITLAVDNRVPDIVTVAERLESEGKLNEIGGLSFLNDLAENTPSAANIHSYASIVQKRSRLRQLIRITADIQETAFSASSPVDSDLILDEAVTKLIGLADKTVEGKPEHIRDSMPGYLEKLDERYRRGSGILGMSTPFDDLDHQTAGLCAGDYIVVAGRPSMGKTSFALNIADHAAANGKTVGIFSLEQPRGQIIDRLMSSRARVDQKKIRVGDIEDSDWPRVVSTSGQLIKENIVIDDTAAITPIYLRTQARHIQRTHGLDLLIIDYLQLMSVAEARDNSRASEISEISRALKAIAKDFKIPVIVLSQLNRSVESRTNKRPRMADLRESGAIEQDADVILFIYRDEVYKEDTPEKGTAEIIIGKQRNGPLGMVRLTFLSQYTRFENYFAQEDWLPPRSS